MIDYSKVLSMPAYGVKREKKEEFFLQYLSELTLHHYERCKEYQRFLDLMGEGGKYENLEDIPFLPVRVFKDFELKSIDNDGIFKTMTSSGTTGQKTSRIVLDKREKP